MPDKRETASPDERLAEFHADEYAWFYTQKAELLISSNAVEQVAAALWAEDRFYAHGEGWIPVAGDKFPEEGTEVLASGFYGGDPRNGRWQAVFTIHDGGVWCTDEDGELTSKSYATHWKPLGAPPSTTDSAKEASNG